MSTSRPAVDVQEPPGGWTHPWPNVVELAREVSNENWTLVGGLMVELHAAIHGLVVTRPTIDVDLIVHIETAQGRVARIDQALRSLGYRLVEPLEEHAGSAHRFVRGSDAARDIVDVLSADHPAPGTREKLGGYPMVTVEGGTQALRRTFNAALEADGEQVMVSVPNVIGALMLKAGAHRIDSRNPERHLYDATTLLACIEDPFGIRAELTSGSDRSRVLYLKERLADPAHPAWLRLTADPRRDGQLALDILAQ